MNKTIKLILAISAVALTLLGVDLWYGSSLVNPAQLTKLLSSSVKDATGRDLKISGPVSLKIFPSIGVTAEQVSLSNASWASDAQMLTLKYIEMNIKLLPLLTGNVEISSMNLKGLDARLQTNKAGVGNWDMTSSASTPDASSGNSATQSTSDDSAFVAIEAVNISDAQISYQEANGSTKIFSLPKFALDKSGSKTSVIVDAQHANYTLGLKGKVSSLRTAIMDWDQSPVKMDIDLVLTLNGKTLDIQGEINKTPKVLPKFDISLNSKSFDLVPLAGSAVIAANGAKVNSVSAPPKAREKYFFSADMLPFDLIPEATGKIALNIDKLGVPDQAPFTNVKANLLFKGQDLEINDLNFAVGKGEAQAQIKLSQFHGPSPVLVAKGIAKDFSLEQIVVTADPNARVSGGNTELAFNISSRGKSLHQIAASANGTVQVYIGNAVLDSALMNKGGDFVITVLDAVNPMRKKTKKTILECAVAYLPIANGIITAKDSVGAVTDRLDILLAGTVNLNTEAINIKINPNEKSGLTTGLDLGSLVMLQGTLQNPSAGINKEGVVNSAVTIGLGIITGGISIAAENAKSLVTKSYSCKTALRPWSDIYPGSK
ncbi:AsmA family protein [Polynucleobacter sp. AP-Kolm-20A-A1]|uniref:AsmA family protein n=1 Tax=Polynucleobacter sp. AP-Kolm-20A-A1 TaxID=2081041 RepID=UPI001BFD2B71|nr:AsmA family protein [Polynucleobacter sp. AP-Kolm-20A-A1]QWE20040.1 AsmA family protein [Polynucleobacter sp. AP-Kolm-20A-A1]